MKIIIVDYNSYDFPCKHDVKSVEWERSFEQQGEEYSPELANTLKSFRVDIRRCKADNNRLIKAQERLAMAQEKKAEFNAVILQILSYLEK